jgi:hypothetical protein
VINHFIEVFYYSDTIAFHLLKVIIYLMNRLTYLMKMFDHFELIIDYLYKSANDLWAVIIDNFAESGVGFNVSG